MLQPMQQHNPNAVLNTNQFCIEMIKLLQVTKNINFETQHQYIATTKSRLNKEGWQKWPGNFRFLNKFNLTQYLYMANFIGRGVLGE